MGYDLDPIGCIDNRHKFYQDAIPQRWLCVFTHDPRTPWAYVERDTKGAYVAVPEAGVHAR